MALVGLFNKKKNGQENTTVVKESLEEREARLKEEKVKSEIDSAVQMVETGKLDEGITILEKHACLTIVLFILTINLVEKFT